MTGKGLDELRAELERIYAQMDAAIEAGTDTTELEDRANDLQDRIGAIADVLGAKVQEQLRARPRREPTTEPHRLF